MPLTPCDIVTQAMEAVNGDNIFSLSGILLQPAVYDSLTSSVIVQFSTDDAVSQTGWRLYWQEVEPVTTTTSTTTTTTIPPCLCQCLPTSNPSLYAAVANNICLSLQPMATLTVHLMTTRCVV